MYENGMQSVFIVHCESCLRLTVHLTDTKWSVEFVGGYMIVIIKIYWESVQSVHRFKLVFFFTFSLNKIVLSMFDNKDLRWKIIYDWKRFATRIFNYWRIFHFQFGMLLIIQCKHILSPKGQSSRWSYLPRDSILKTRQPSY